jgi:hypothetical protein
MKGRAIYHLQITGSSQAVGRGRRIIQSRLINLVATLACVLAACTSNVSGRYPGVAMPIVAQAPDAGIIAIAGQASGAVRVMFARNGGMVLIKDIRLPPGQSVTNLSVSADGRNVVIGTESAVYLASGGTWKLQTVGVLTRGPLVDASRGS